MRRGPLILTLALGLTGTAPPAAATVETISNTASIRIDAIHNPPLLQAGSGSFCLLMWIRRSVDEPQPADIFDAAGVLDISVGPAGKSLRAVLHGRRGDISVSLDAAGLPVGEWSLLAVSWDGPSATLAAWSRSTSAAPGADAVSQPGFGHIGPAGGVVIGYTGTPGHVAQRGTYGLMVLRGHTLTAADVDDLWTTRDYLGPYRADNTSTGGSLVGTADVQWMTGHTISSAPGHGLVNITTPAFVGGPVETTNLCVYTPAGFTAFFDAGLLSETTGFVHASPFDDVAFFERAAVDFGLPGPPALSSHLSPRARALALDLPAGLTRVVVSGNSRAVRGTSAQGLTLPEQFSSGFIEARLASTAGVLNRPAKAGGGARWFGYDTLDPPRVAGTVYPFDATLLPERTFSYLWTNAGTSIAVGTGTGLMLTNDTLFSMKCRPEAGSLLDGTAGDGSTADFPLVVRAYVLRFPGSGAVSWRPERSTAQNLAGTFGPPTQTTLDTTILTHALSSAAGDVVISGTRTITLGSDLTPTIGVGDACYVAAGAGAGGISVIESVRLLAGPVTEVVLEKWYTSPPVVDDSTLTFGPWSVQSIEHTFEAQGAADPEIFRGLELTASGGPVALFACDAWRPDVAGWIFGGYGSGGSGYDDQIERAFSQTHERAAAALQPDLWLQGLAQQFSQPDSMSAFLGVLRGSVPATEVAWLGESDHRFHHPTWHVYILEAAAAEGVVSISVAEENLFGLMEDQAVDGLRIDGAHYSHRGNVRIASRWLALLEQAALQSGDLDGDGAVGITDLLALLGAWGPCTVECAADLDGDGTVGVSDLLLLLAAWS